jgi:hypothetical protein
MRLRGSNATGNWSEAAPKPSAGWSSWGLRQKGNDGDGGRAGAEGEEMSVDGLQELVEMAAKLESTIQKLPAVKRDELLRDIQRIRAQLTALLSVPCRSL